MLSVITAQCVIEGMAPLCQSRYHDEPHLEGETAESYDIRTWPKKMHVMNKTERTPNGTVHIPAKALHDALTSAAQYTKRQIPGQGKATWTQKFASGIALLSDIDLGIDPTTVDYVSVFCHTSGKPGQGSRVIRRFPIIPVWRAAFEVKVLDPIITEEVFKEMMEQAGMFIGLGQNRPQNRGTHGRFSLVSVVWVGKPEIDERRIRAA